MKSNFYCYVLEMKNVAKTITQTSYLDYILKKEKDYSALV